VEEVGALGGVEGEHARDGVEHLRGGVDVAALLEPGVPRQPHAGELRHLLATQAGRAAPAVDLQPDLLGRDPRAPAAQELGQLDAPG
jgi:hypothetical protein